MKHHLAIVGTISLTLVASSASAFTRAGIQTTSSDPAGGGSKTAATGSPFTIGTMYGVAVPMYKPEFFRISGRRIEVVRDNEPGDYVSPAVFVLPSLAVWTVTYTAKTLKQDRETLKKHINNPRALTEDDYDYNVRGRTISVILPAGLSLRSSDGKDVSIGIGASLGWSLTSGSEVGIALAAVWSQVPYLSNEQKRYIGQALPDGVSDQIDTRLRPAAVLGLYLTPTF
ncbi:uncharacterized protein SOCE26_030310 [Sorangium cellulosum]|uniref:Secreted protein n=1 Tax=Sorangium cellulosum TaxID=56 RepID=A0A2L0EQR4_SORCE|nr:hypothetical protein [Sorangium cellulosum]AUX41610.1 uncharacterized protein SOCE26_030310 [Sorangium cellulosum]